MAGASGRLLGDEIGNLFPLGDSVAERIDSGYSMSTAAVRELHRSMERSAEQIEATLLQLSTELDSLQPKWSGEAAEAYRNAQAQWLSSMERLRGMLESAGGSAGATIDRHVEARRRVAQLWR